MTQDRITQPAAGLGLSENTSVLWHRIGAVALGVFFIGMVGFAPMEVVHNAAHDTRHSLAFPCH